MHSDHCKADKSQYGVLQDDWKRRKVVEQSNPEIAKPETTFLKPRRETFNKDKTAKPKGWYISFDHASKANP